MFHPRKPAFLFFLAAALLAGGGVLALRERAMAAEMAALRELQAAQAGKAAAANPAAATELASCIQSFAAAPADPKGAFGEFRKLLGGETRSMKDLLVGACVLEPGQQIHPAHVHADEEFLYVAKGEGTWNLNGKESAAHEGDVLYVQPWVLHGLLNTGKEKLTFFVVKWNGRQLPVPEQPKPAK
jgi:mannose-6-phosphate isomerase-like protein (cupin superfamily)